MEIWTCLVCLVPDPSCKDFRRFGDGKGAYVNVMAWADSAKQFQQRVKESAKRLDCMIREMEKIEFLEAALKREECPDECGNAGHGGGLRLGNDSEAIRYLP